MRIAVNTRYLLKGKLEGIGWFMYETLKRITNEHPEHEFIFIFDRPYDKEYIFSDNVSAVVAPPPARHPVLWYLWFEWSIPYVLKKYKADLFVSLDGYLSMASDVPTVVAIHDVNFEHYPKSIPWSMYKFLHYYSPRYAHKAKRIITVSEFSKKDISEQYGIDPAKIDVVYNGANEDYKPVSDQVKISIRDKYSSGEEYFLYVGSIHARKNMENMMNAYDEFKKKHHTHHKFLIVGNKKWWTDSMEKTYQSLTFKNDVIFMGRVPMDELLKITASAFALVYVPFFEGFGIPITEAMKCEVPVITSNITSMPEVAGDAALLIDPFSVASITSAMEKLVNNEKLRTELIGKGKVQATVFYWQRTADLLWQSIEKAMDSLLTANS
jgi:glycosyltransferase involved in cell wall biosynthesis